MEEFLAKLPAAGMLPDDLERPIITRTGLGAGVAERVAGCLAPKNAYCHRTD